MQSVAQAYAVLVFETKIAGAVWNTRYVQRETGGYHSVPFIDAY